MTDQPGPVPTIARLVGIYNAEHTLRGELAYWVGARLGRAHCALCDITHGLVRERADWRECRDGLPVPFDTFHLDDQPADVRALLDGRAPAVVARTDVGLTLLLGEAELDRCGGSPEKLSAALTEAATRAGLDWVQSGRDLR